MRIDGTDIGQGARPYIIAEISANHNGSIATARKLISQAKECGASAVKLQTYTADTLTIDSRLPDFQITGGLWSGRSLYDLYEEAHTPWEWHEELFFEAKLQGITIFSSPFDVTAIDLLESLDCPAYKIASFEIVDLELIRVAASTGKPLIISTGLANECEIREALDVAQSNGAESVALLHCLSSYPAPPSEYNLNSIPYMRAKFGVEVGLSDHTLGNNVAVASVALGATLVEKHFTSNTQGSGPDDSFSMDSDGLTDLRSSADEVWSALGFDDLKVQESERSNLRFRRSLYFVRDVVAGQTITTEDVRAIRPGFGLPPKFKDRVVGQMAKRDFLRGERVTSELTN